MYFKRLEIHGFKSFAEPVVIEFDRGITCVVGPNGSGKSNICDAIRWVLGAQSAKMLRGDKMEDVIFSGTASRRSRGMAEVTLVIDNGSGNLPIDYNEVAITRRMYRSGESEYLINNNTCRMKDIRELIMDTGIGVEGYSIIGQGKIADIISNNTDSIREILEETAGIVMYRSKKADGERKLKSAQDNMERVNDIIGEIDQRIDGLREDSQKAEEYIGLRNRYKELEINITLKNVEAIQLKNEYLKDDISQLQYSIDENKDKKGELTSSLEETMAEREGLDHRIESARASHLEAVDQYNLIAGSHQVSQERLAAIEADQERIQGELAEISQKMEGEAANREEILRSKDQVETQLSHIKEKLEEAQGHYNSQASLLAEKKEEVDLKKNSIFGLQVEKNNINSEIRSIEALMETMTIRKNLLLARENEADTGRDSREKDLKTCREEETQAAMALGQAKENRKKLGEERTELIKDQKSLATKLEENKVEVGRLWSRRKAFEEMENNYEGYNNGVKFLMKEQLAGIEGVVADLINVPAGLETAIETALGATMQNIVCKDDATAKRAIIALKESKAGRLTFLPMETINPRQVSRQSNIDKALGFKGYGVDCITYQSKYKSIMEYLLANVIVMDHMDNAVDLSKITGGRFKIVTLDGEIISGSGAITGGRYRNKTANILERKVEIRSLGETLEQRRIEIQEDTEKLAQMEGKLANLDQAIVKCGEEIATLDRQVMTLEGQIAIHQAALKDIEEYTTKRDKELAQIKEEQESSEATLARLGEEDKSLAQAMTLLEEEIETMALDFTDDEEAVAKVRDSLSDLRVEATTIEGEKQKLEAIGGRIEESIEDYKGQIEARNQALINQQAERQAILDENKDFAQKIKAKEQEKNGLEATMAQLTEEKANLLKVYEEESKAKEEVDIILGTLQNQRYELDVKQARQETQLENAKNKLWEEFELSYIQAMEFKDKEFQMSAAVKENREIKARIKELGQVNIGAIEEYATVSKRHTFLMSQREDIEKSMAELNKLIGDMDKTIRKRFKESFDQVTENFEAVFRQLYGGGHAKIYFSDENNPFDSEIEIIAQPPGKQLKHINLLSGGEKTMTAISLMFAVLKTKPTPCCILDEVEAALDDSNLNIFGRYLREFGGVQFTLITHQKATMEHADVMYGITMPESGVSKVYSLKMGQDPLM